MHATLFTRLAAWRWFAAARPSRHDVALPPADEPALDLAATEALDRSTAWPTHRIRCVLHSRREGPR